MDVDQRDQLAQAQNDAKRFLLLFEGSQAKLRQAQEEVARLTLFIEIDIPRILISRLDALKQALSPSEAKDARD